MKNFGWDTANFNYTKQKAVEAAGKIMESRTDLSGMKVLKCPDSVAELFKPYTCRIRLWIFKHVLLVVPVSLLVFHSWADLTVYVLPSMLPKLVDCVKVYSSWLLQC